MKIETMMRALTMAQLAWHHPGDYRMRTRLDWFEMVQRIFAGIARRYTALQAQRNGFEREAKRLWERVGQLVDENNALQAENARLRAENARVQNEIDFWAEKCIICGKHFSAEEWVGRHTAANDGDCHAACCDNKECVYELY